MEPSRGIVEFLLEVLLLVLPESSQSLIQLKETPQNAALNWLSTMSGAKELSLEEIAQRYALAVLYFATGGGNWAVDGQWLAEGSECQWDPERIECEEGIIRILDLNSANLNGTLPPDIVVLKDLCKLRHFVVRQNEIIPLTSLPSSLHRQVDIA